MAAARAEPVIITRWTGKYSDVAPMDSSVGIGDEVEEVSGGSVAIACQELNEIPARHASYSKREVA